MNDYLTIDTGGYVCMNSLRALVAAWLVASLRRCLIYHVCEGVARSPLIRTEDWLLRYIRNFLYFNVLQLNDGLLRYCCHGM